MKKKITLILFSISLNLSAQKLCKGLLFDSLTGQPIEFANIGIIGKAAGTVSDEKGAYQLMVPDSLLNFPLKISVIGYHSKSFTVNAFEKLSRITLASHVTTLNEVSVTAKKTKIKILGNGTRTKHVSGGFKNNSLGAELAVKLDINHPQTHLRKFMIHINSNSLGKSPVFRFNLYDADKKGFPNENILKQNIIIEPKEMTGLIELDLTPYQIFVDKDVFISLEWIKDLGDAKGLYFSTKLVGGSTYFRQASQDKWEKTSPIGVGLHAEAAY